MWRHEQELKKPQRSSWPQERHAEQSAPINVSHTHCASRQLGTTLLKDLTSLRTDFETHAYWQGYTEKPTAKDFVARKACAIALGKAQGTHWNRIKCKECLRNCPEAVIGQATINIYSLVWKSLEDSLPKLYCMDIAEADTTQESASLRPMCRKKRKVDTCLPNAHLH